MMERYIIRNKKNDEGTVGPPTVTNTCENASSTIAVKENKLRKQMLTSFETSFKKMKVTRLYSEEYLQYGLTKWVDSNENDRPLCMLCDDVLANESLKPSKLKRQ